MCQDRERVPPERNVADSSAGSARDRVCCGCEHCSEALECAGQARESDCCLSEVIIGRIIGPTRESADRSFGAGSHLRKKAPRLLVEQPGCWSQREPLPNFPDEV